MPEMPGRSREDTILGWGLLHLFRLPDLIAVPQSQFLRRRQEIGNRLGIPQLRNLHGRAIMYAVPRIERIAVSREN